VRPWLYTVATNQAIDAQRRNRRHRMVSLDRRRSMDGVDDEDGGTLMNLLDSQDMDPIEQFTLEEDSPGGSRGHRPASRIFAPRGALGLLPGAEVSRGGRRVVDPGGNREEPFAHGRGEVERVVNRKPIFLDMGDRNNRGSSCWATCSKPWTTANGGGSTSNWQTIPA